MDSPFIPFSAEFIVVATTQTLQQATSSRNPAYSKLFLCNVTIMIALGNDMTSGILKITLNRDLKTRLSSLDLLMKNCNEELRSAVQQYVTLNSVERKKTLTREFKFLTNLVHLELAHTRLCNYMEQLCLVKSEIAVELVVQHGAEVKRMSFQGSGSTLSTILKLRYGCTDTILKQSYTKSVTECGVGYESTGKTSSEIRVSLFHDGAPITDTAIKEKIFVALENVKWEDFGLTLENVTEHWLNGQMWAALSEVQRSFCVHILLHCRDATVEQPCIDLIPSLCHRALLELKTRIPEQFASKRELQKAQLLKQCIPEIAASVSNIIKRSSNRDFQDQMLKVIGVESIDAIQEQLASLMSQQCTLKKPAKRKVDTMDT